MADTFDLTRVSWVQTELDLDFFLRGALEEAETVVFDLETTGLEEHAVTGGKLNGGVAARVVVASFTLDNAKRGLGEEMTDNPVTYLVPLSHPESSFSGKWRETYTRIAKALRGKKLVGHNVKFDARYTYATTGVELRKHLFWDTQISSALLDENNSTALKQVVPRTFGVERWDDVELKTPGAAEREPLMKLGEYAARDTYWTYKLLVNHLDRMQPMEQPYFPDEIEEARLGSLAHWVAMPTVRTLTGIEERGLLLENDWVHAQMKELEEQRDTAYAFLANLYPDNPEDNEQRKLEQDEPSFAPTSLWFKEWADRAVFKGDLRVAALTPQGKPQWSADVLKKQSREGSEVATQLLAYRNAVKRLEFLRSWLDMQTPDGRVHANYNAGSVVTGRLSSSSPNMQQITKKLKPAYIPTPGYYLAELDYSQIELRVAAFISRCQPMIDAFKRGDDLHTLLAARVNNVSEEEVTPIMRQGAKAGNFGLLYSMSPRGFKIYAETVYGVAMSDEEALKISKTYFAMWDGLHKWHAQYKKTVHSRGRVVSPIGRVRRLEHMVYDGDPWTVLAAERAAINSPVQGMASDIMQVAGAIIDGNIEGWERVKGARIVGTVHDSIMVEVKADNWEEVTLACKSAMEDAVPLVLEKMGVEFDVPLVADAEVGTRYGISDIGAV